VLGRMAADPARSAQEAADLLRLVESSEDEMDFALRVLRGASSPTMVEGLPEMWAAGVAPHWNRITAYLEAETAIRGGIVVTRGVDELLSTLHPQIVWDPPVLKVPGEVSGSFSLDGRGLVICPSVFLCDMPGRLVGSEHPALVFAAPPNPDQAAALWGGQDDQSDEALGALVGQTRAAVLLALRATCTTSQLADLLGITAAGASQHTGVLRRAGLVTTRRIRNTALHMVTPLGRALLTSRGVRN
jgi:DNA-binding transcriptional ArsR family regulator